KYLELPLGNYAYSSYDRILAGDQVIGISTTSGFSWNERAMLSMAVVDADVPEGAEVTLVWGEAGGGSKKTTVERHRQYNIRAIVSPAPFCRIARENYAIGWRTKRA